jgi:hypothetical protein
MRGSCLESVFYGQKCAVLQPYSQMEKRRKMHFFVTAECEIAAPGAGICDFSSSDSAVLTLEYADCDFAVAGRVLVGTHLAAANAELPAGCGAHRFGTIPVGMVQG